MRAVGAGVVCGAVIGGLLGRLAMFVLRLTSSDRVRGLRTDDDFVIGRFDAGDTLGLVVFTAVLGGVAAMGYGAFRWLIPTELRPAASSVIFGGLGGSLILEPGAFDFVVLEPRALSVAMFVALPTLFGFALAWVVERVERPGAPLRWWQATPAAPVVLAVPVVVVAVAITALVRAARRSPRVAEVARSPQATLVARLGLAAITAVMLGVTIDDARQIL